jgi:hypothetical protein
MAMRHNRSLCQVLLQDHAEMFNNQVKIEQSCDLSGTGGTQLKSDLRSA